MLVTISSARPLQKNPVVLCGKYYRKYYRIYHRIYHRMYHRIYLHVIWDITTGQYHRGTTGPCPVVLVLWYQKYYRTVPQEYNMFTTTDHYHTLPLPHYHRTVPQEVLQDSTTEQYHRAVPQDSITGLPQDCTTGQYHRTVPKG